MRYEGIIESTISRCNSEELRKLFDKPILITVFLLLDHSIGSFN